MGQSKNAGENNPMFGKKHSEEARRKMALGHLGKKLPSFTEEHRRKLSQAFKGKSAGEKNHFWKGGVKHNNGYLKIYTPDHPYADKDGYVYEHRLVMEKHLGRFLLPHERPHHINGIKTDNRIENLRLFDGNGKHMLEGGHITKDARTGRFIGHKRSGRLLDGRT